MTFKNICILTIGLVSIIACKKDTPQQEEIVEEIVEIPDPVEFGFHLNEYIVKKDTIRKGDSFGEILQRNHIDYSKVFQIAQKTKDTFDIRRLQVGKPYTLFCVKEDSLEIPQHFVYQPNKEEYVVINFADSINAFSATKPIKYVEKEASGIITNNISLALEEQG